MRELRTDEQGRWLCQADDCDEVGVHVWERLDDEDNRIPVYGCAEHRLGDEEAALLHQPACVAPPTCTCDPT